jgi:NAD(P)-dependent dehydrogenase (short-subunit alcohol dehydrogenase family)
MTATAGQTALIIGASRGLGYALAAEYLARGWRLTATVRGAQHTELHDLAASSAGRLTGTIAVMSSGQGSVANNERGGFEVYRASKSALNQLMRSFAARHADDPHTFVLMAPGWVQTHLGGPAAPLTIDQSIPGVVDTIGAQAGQGGLQYLDYQGKTVRW